MDKTRLGFVPCHRYPCDEDWATGMRQRCLKALRGVGGVELVTPSPALVHNGLVRDDAGAQAAIDLFAQRGVQGLLLGAMSYGDALAACTVAQALNVPVLVFATHEGPPPEEGTLRSDAYGGALAIAAGLQRRGIAYHFAGAPYPEDAAFAEAVDAFARGCAALHALQGARVGLLGAAPERDEDAQADPGALLQRWRVRVAPLDLTSTLGQAQDLAADDHRVVATVRSIMKDANCAACSEAALTAMARLELILETLCKDHNLTALAVSTAGEVQARFGSAFGATLSRLATAGLLTCGSADVYGALSMLVQRAASHGDGAPVCVDLGMRHADQRNVLLVRAHAGAHLSLAADAGAVVLREQADLAAHFGADKAQGAYEFALKPGAVTLCRLAQTGGQFSMWIAGGEVLPGAEPFRGVWGWVRLADLERGYRVLGERGLPPRASLIHGDVAEALQSLCRFAGIEAVRL